MSYNPIATAPLARSALYKHLRTYLQATQTNPLMVITGASSVDGLINNAGQQIIDGYETWKQDLDGVLMADDIVRTAAFMYAQLSAVA